MRDKDGKLGLRIESAASITARDTATQHISTFQHIIRQDRHASASTVAVYVDALAGVVALSVAGGHLSRDEAIEATVKALRDAIERDLKHVGHK